MSQQHLVTAVIVQARVGSTRLPRKALLELAGRSMLEQELRRIKGATKIDSFALTITTLPEDDALVPIAERCGFVVSRGETKEVLNAYYETAKLLHADVVVRITGDCPLMDPAVIDEVVSRFQSEPGRVDYLSTPANYPEGLDVEVFTFNALEAAAQHAVLPSEKEHVTPYIKSHPESFTCDTWTSGEEDNSSMHWSVDTAEDFAFVGKVYDSLYKEGTIFHKNEVIELLRAHPELLEINKGGTGYEGLEKSLKEDAEFLKQNS